MMADLAPSEIPSARLRAVSILAWIHVDGATIMGASKSRKEGYKRTAPQRSSLHSFMYGCKLNFMEHPGSTVLHSNPK
jgi:hypothetical protein